MQALDDIVGVTVQDAVVYRVVFLLDAAFFGVPRSHIDKTVFWQVGIDHAAVVHLETPFVIEIPVSGIRGGP